MKIKIIGALFALSTICACYAQTTPDQYEPDVFHLQGTGNPQFGQAFIVNGPGESAGNWVYWTNSTGHDIYLLDIHVWAGWAEGCHADTGFTLFVDGKPLYGDGWDHYMDSEGSGGSKIHDWTPPFLPDVHPGHTVMFFFIGSGYNSHNLDKTGNYHMIRASDGSSQMSTYNWPAWATYNVWADVEYVATRQ